MDVWNHGDTDITNRGQTKNLEKFFIKVIGDYIAWMQYFDWAFRSYYTIEYIFDTYIGIAGNLANTIIFSYTYNNFCK